MAIMHKKPRLGYAATWGGAKASSERGLMMPTLKARGVVTMGWNVLLTARAAVDAGARARDLLTTAGCTLTVADPFGPLTLAQLASAIQGQEAVIASTDDYSAGFFARPEAASLKCVSRWGVGLDCVDLAAATSAGVVVCNTPRILDEAVADYTWALLFAIARRVARGSELMGRGEWDLAWGHGVHSKTLGIVGCGQIGRAVARRATGFGMRVLGFDPFADDCAGIERVPLEQLLRESDFVSLHCSLTPENRGMLNADRLALLKPSAYLINTARGALVDEEALVVALQQGRFAGAAIDAYAAEPLPAASPLRTCPRLLLTPHQAFNAIETGEEVSLAAASAIVDLMQGNRPRHTANPDVFAHASLRAAMTRQS
jgi:phosphoglycerate dehydrogenase-like enzyme